MAMNMIQFQPGLSLPEFMGFYGTEAKCRPALYRWRWPAGFRCPAFGARHRLSFRRGGHTLTSAVPASIRPR
ncbi:Transposase zinc-ribbon domain-containing protein [Aquimonas voraii]|uniref:Transposase zinc-ribbon domain-containing protein n=1 Tax=Aquimonas voraii TaxID=265719 RepID=A0A1G6Z3N8_9GAMM|nr:Transposase zinc-ribbon domain-containing protein [Aquimonas voraii]